MPHKNRTWFRRSQDPWWDQDGQAVPRHRKLKAVVDFGILAVAILTLAVVFGSRPVAF